MPNDETIIVVMQRLHEDDPPRWRLLGSMRR